MVKKRTLIIGRQKYRLVVDENNKIIGLHKWFDLNKKHNLITSLPKESIRDVEIYFAANPAKKQFSLDPSKAPDLNGKGRK